MEKGTDYVSGKIKTALNRLAVLNSSQSRLRDFDETWEAYYDLEEAILMAKIVFEAFDRPGRIRKLRSPSKLSDEEIRAALRTAEDNLLKAEQKLIDRAGDQTVEFLRRARDELKIILLVSIAKRQKRRASS